MTQNLSTSTLYDTAFWHLSQPCKNKGGPDPFNDEIVQYHYNVLQPTRWLTSWQAAEDNHRAKPQHLGGFLGPLVETKDAKFISGGSKFHPKKHVRDRVVWVQYASIMFNMSVSSSDGWFLDTFDRTMEMVHCSRISQVIRLDLKPLPIGFPWRLSLQFNTSISPNKSYESKSTIIRTPSYQDSKHQKGLNKTKPGEIPSEECWTAEFQQDFDAWGRASAAPGCSDKKWWVVCCQWGWLKHGAPNKPITHTVYDNTHIICSRSWSPPTLVARPLEHVQHPTSTGSKGIARLVMAPPPTGASRIYGPC